MLYWNERENIANNRIDFISSLLAVLDSKAAAISPSCCDVRSKILCVLDKEPLSPGSIIANAWQTWQPCAIETPSLSLVRLPIHVSVLLAFFFYVLRKELGPTVSKNRLGEIESNHPIVPFMLFLSLLRARTSICIRICISSTTRSAAKQRRMKTTKTNSSSIICISTSQILINARVSVCAIASSLTQTHSRNRCNRALRSSISFFWGIF